MWNFYKSQKSTPLIVTYADDVNTTFPKPAVGNLFDPDKIKFNQIVSIDLKQWKELVDYLHD